MCEKLLDETKKMIKSIVIPHPNGVNLKTLCEEYEEFEGIWHLNKRLKDLLIDILFEMKQKANHCLIKS